MALNVLRSLTVPIALLAATAAVAAEGEIEINQAAALAGGITETDAPGFPVTLSSAGRAYRLTGNLVMTQPGVSAIKINADNVELDMAGFVIHCPFPCPGRRGIDAQGRQHVTVRNGTVITFAEENVIAGDFARIERVRSVAAEFSGIKVGETSTVTLCQVIGGQPGAAAIFANAGSHLDRNVSIQNQGQGLLAGRGSVVRGNVLRSNGTGIDGSLAVQAADNVVSEVGGVGHGIETLHSSLVTGNVVSGAGMDGINVGSYSTVQDNLVLATGGDNIAGTDAAIVGNLTLEAGGDHIDAAGASRVQNNVATWFAAGVSLRMSSETAYWGNYYDTKTGGIDMGGNFE